MVLSGGSEKHRKSDTYLPEEEPGKNKRNSSGSNSTNKGEHCVGQILNSKRSFSRHRPRQHTHFKVINEVRNKETETGNSSGQQDVFQRGHVGNGMILIDNFIDIITIGNLDRGSYMENLVQAIPARLYLQGIREHDEHDDGQLPNSDE